MLEGGQEDGADVVVPSNLGARSAICTVGVTYRRWGIRC